jgi:O-antigen/teichoic acid export membrane protein
MSEIKNNTSKIIKNTIYNLLGFIFPIMAALIFIPTLLEKLGDEKFGLLNIIWIVVGYFSLFDFGVSRTLTKVISEKLSHQDRNEIPEIFWTSFYLILVFSIAGSIILFLLTPTMVNDVLNITDAIKKESTISFYIMAFSIPVITTTASFRGFLEAYQKFKVINLLRIIWGVSTFLMPILVLIYTDYLTYIVFSLVFLRLIMWLVHLIICIKTENKLIVFKIINVKAIKPIFVLSGWITVTNIIAPLIVYVDRFLIGTLISAKAITYFATPFEIISKVLLIPSAIVGVLYPVIAFNYRLDFELVRKIFLKGTKYIFLIVFPIVVLMMVLAKSGLSIWVGERIANQSWLIMQLLAFGIFFNSLAQIPFTYLQAIGKPRVTAKLHMIELPFYFIAMWFSISMFGVNGAAAVWLLRSFVDCIVLFILSREIFSARSSIINKTNLLYGVISIFLVSILFIVPLNIKILLSICYSIIYVSVIWLFILDSEERSHLIAIVRLKEKD